MSKMVLALGALALVVSLVEALWVVPISLVANTTR